MFGEIPLSTTTTTGTSPVTSDRLNRRGKGPGFDIFGCSVVVVPDLRGNLNAMHDHVGGAEQVGQGLLLHTSDAGLDLAFLVGCLGLLPQVFDGTGQEAPRATGGVQDGLAQLGVDAVDSEFGDGPGCVVLARVTGALEVPKKAFVDLPKEVPVLRVIEVDGGLDLVDHLPQQSAVLHVLVERLDAIPAQPGHLHPSDHG